MPKKLKAEGTEAESRNGKSKSYKNSNCLAKTNDVSNNFCNADG